MTTVDQLQMAVDSLTEEEYVQFRAWFLDRDWERWEREIEEDAKAGSLDFLIQEAVEAKSRKNLQDL